MDSKVVKKVSTTNLVLLAALVAGISLVILILAGRVLWKQITLNGRVISKKQAAEKQLKANIEAIPTLTQNYQSLDGTKDTINNALPTKADFPALVAMMEAVAGTSGVELDSVSPSANGSATASPATAAQVTTNPTAVAAATSGVNTTVSEPTKTEFSVSIKGTYANITTFLTNLQLSARPVSYSSMKLSGTTADLTADLDLYSYYYAPTVLQDKTEVVK